MYLILEIYTLLFTYCGHVGSFNLLEPNICLALLLSLGEALPLNSNLSGRAGHMPRLPYYTAQLRCAHAHVGRLASVYDHVAYEPVV